MKYFAALLVFALVAGAMAGDVFYGKGRGVFGLGFRGPFGNKGFGFGLGRGKGYYGDYYGGYSGYPYDGYYGYGRGYGYGGPFYGGKGGYYGGYY